MNKMIFHNSFFYVQHEVCSKSTESEAVFTKTLKEHWMKQFSSK